MRRSASTTEIIVAIVAFAALGAGILALTAGWWPRECRCFTCPRCRRTNHHPVDVREGYCGACQVWTGLAPGEPVLSQERMWSTGSARLPETPKTPRFRPT